MDRKIRRKSWLDARSRRMQNKKKIKGHYSGRKSSRGVKQKRDRTGYAFYATAPENFSFVSNPEETIEYFDGIISEISKKTYKRMFYIDSGEVVKVSADALIYLIAILNNLKSNLVSRYSFKGNLPSNREAEAFYVESGFLNYVKSRRIAMPEGDDRVQIISGKTTDTKLAKKVCDFVCEKFGEKKLFTLGLYKTLIELMSNTVQHAYNSKGIMVACWYLFARNANDSVQITFIDTGDGIPGTVRRKWFEKIPKMITDSELIYSAFMGESRTETKKVNRGHGLPSLYDRATKRELSDFHVLSGKGICEFVEVAGEIVFEKRDFNKSVIGTIYQFNISKRGAETCHIG